MVGLENGATRAFDAVSRIVRETRAEQDAGSYWRAVARQTAECMGYRAAALGIVNGEGMLEFTVFGEAPDCHDEKACREAPALAPDGSWISAPLAGIGRSIGTLICYGHGAGAFAADDLRVHVELCDCLAVILEAQMATENLAQALHQDPVTGLYNRKHLLKRIDEEISRTERYGGQFAVVFLDIVGLREINAAFGHGMGDAVIEAVARALKRSFRGSDAAARFGDDEFAVLLPGADKPRGQIVANRISRTVACTPIARDGVRMQGPDLDWCVVAHPVDGSTRDQLLAAREDASMS
jgi:diguanylate cyclase (GGDEF)-like protein